MIKKRKGEGCFLLAVTAVLSLSVTTCDIQQLIRPTGAEQAKNDLKALGRAIEAFEADYGYPPLVKDIDSLIAQVQPTYAGRVRRADPWGNPYNYDFDNRDFTFTVWSLGPDGKPSHLGSLEDEIVYRDRRILSGSKPVKRKLSLSRLQPPGTGSFYLALSIPLIVFVIVGSATWVGMDCARWMRGIPNVLRRDMGRPRSAAGWVTGCLLMFVVFFPWYLIRRPKYRSLQKLYKARQRMTPAARALQSIAASPEKGTPAGSASGPKQPHAPAGDNPGHRVIFQRPSAGGFGFGFKFAFGFWLCTLLVVIIIFGIAVALKLLDGWEGLVGR